MDRWKSNPPSPEKITFHSRATLWMSTKIKWELWPSWSSFYSKHTNCSYLGLSGAAAFLKKNMKVVVHNYPGKMHSSWGFLFWLCLFITIMNNLSTPALCSTKRRSCCPWTHLWLPESLGQKKLQNSRYWSPNYKEIWKNTQTLENSVQGVESKRGTKIYYNKIIKSFLKV